MENKNKEILLEKVDELIYLIKNGNDYKKYTELKEKMKENKDIISLIEKIKKLERTVVKKEYQKEDATNEIEEINILKEELNSFPIYLEYTYLQQDINNDLQNIKNIIENSINDNI